MQPQVTIDPEFARLIPPHTAAEVAMLTQSCVADGIREPLVVWHERGVLLDGHTRLRIAQEHELPYRTSEISFSDAVDARTWVLNNQLARRNLHPNGASYLRGKRYLAEKQRQGEYQKANSLLFEGDTSERLAVELGVSHQTIKNDAAFALAVDYLCGDETAVEMGAILSGDTEWTRKDIMDRHASALRAAEAAAKAAGASEKEAKQAAKAVVDDAPAPETVPQEVLEAASEAADEVVEETAAIAEEAKKQDVKPREVAKAKAREKREAAVAAQVAEDPNPPLIALADWHEWLPAQPACDLLLTDPPYMTDVDDIAAFAAEWLPAALGKVKPTGRAYVCIGAYPDELRAYLSAAATIPTMHLANILVWTYRNTMGPSPTLDYKQNWQAILYFRGADAPPLDCPILTEQFSVQDINAPDGRRGDRYHTWQKPDELAERFVLHSTKPGATVLDPFAGTGTFILAAARLGRSGSGCDASEDMLDIAVQRGCVRG